MTICTFSPWDAGRGVGARLGKHRKSLLFSGGEKHLRVITGGALSAAHLLKDTLLLVLDEHRGGAGGVGSLRIGDDEDQVRLGELFSVVHPGWGWGVGGGTGRGNGRKVTFYCDFLLYNFKSWTFHLSQNILKGPMCNICLDL